MKRWPLSLLFLPLASLAAPTSPSGGADKAPITIEADSMELNQRSGTNHYKGNVVLVRGTLEIKADSIILYTRNNKLQRAVAEGKPVRLEQKETGEYAAMRAEAEHMEYLPQSDAIELKGKALLWRDGNEFTGEKIHYDLKRQTVKATGNGQGNGRVRVLLQPESEPPQTEEKQ